MIGFRPFCSPPGGGYRPYLSPCSCRISFSPLLLSVWQVYVTLSLSMTKVSHMCFIFACSPACLAVLRYIIIIDDQSITHVFHFRLFSCLSGGLTLTCQSCVVFNVRLLPCLVRLLVFGQFDRNCQIRGTVDRCMENYFFICRN